MPELASTPTDTARPRLLLLDGHSLAYRAFFALPVENFSTSTGQPTNAVYGFTSMLINLLRDEEPTHLAVAFDVSRHTFRTEEYADYKANRSSTPDEFKGQVSLIHEVLDALRITVVEKEAYEADDVIATLATQAQAAGMEVLICSGDRDSFQLVSDTTTVLYPVRGVSELWRMTPAAVEQKYLVPPGSYPDLEAQLIKNTVNISKLGMDAFPCHLGHMRIDEDSNVWVGDRHVDVIYRSFLIEDLLDPTGPALIEPVLQAAERGKVKIFSPMDAELYGSKGALALLSDEANRGVFDEQELRCLDRILPWTRMVRPGPVTVAGRSVLLEDYAISEREQLILKPVMLHGGAGVVPGWQTSPEEWAGQLADAMGGEFVLQKRIYPHTELFPSDEGLTEWLLVWGAFLGARGYSGMFLRGGPAEAQNAVVNTLNGATGSCCFHELG